MQLYFEPYVYGSETWWRKCATPGPSFRPSLPNSLHEMGNVSQETPGVVMTMQKSSPVGYAPTLIKDSRVMWYTGFAMGRTKLFQYA